MGDANLPIGSGNVHAVQLAVGEVEEEDEGVSALDRLTSGRYLRRQAHLRRVRAVDPSGSGRLWGGGRGPACL